MAPAAMKWSGPFGLLLVLWFTAPSGQRVVPRTPKPSPSPATEADRGTRSLLIELDEEEEKREGESDRTTTTATTTTPGTPLKIEIDMEETPENGTGTASGLTESAWHPFLIKISSGPPETTTTSQPPALVEETIVMQLPEPSLADTQHSSPTPLLVDQAVLLEEVPPWLPILTLSEQSESPKGQKPGAPKKRKHKPLEEGEPEKPKPESPARKQKAARRTPTTKSGFLLPEGNIGSGPAQVFLVIKEVEPDSTTLLEEHVRPVDIQIIGNNAQGAGTNTSVSGISTKDAETLTVKNSANITNALGNKVPDVIVRDKDTVTKVPDMIVTDKDTVTKVPDVIVTEKDTVTKVPDVIVTEKDTVTKVPDVNVTDKDTVTKVPDVNVTDNDTVAKVPGVIVTEKDTVAKALNVPVADKDTFTKVPDVIVTEKDSVTEALNVPVADKDTFTKVPDVIVTEKDTVTKVPDVIVTDKDTVTKVPDVNVTDKDTVAKVPDVNVTDKDTVAKFPDVIITDADAVASVPDVIVTDANIATRAPEVIITDTDAGSKVPEINITDTDTVSSTQTFNTKSIFTSTEDTNAAVNDNKSEVDETILSVSDKGVSVMESVTKVTVPDPYFKELYFNQLVDHFSFTSHQKLYRQRYLITDQFWAMNFGPIFLYTGNEGDIWDFANSSRFLIELASELQAMVIYAEHRYYGKSLPFGKKSYEKSNIEFLTVEQAVADYVVLITKLKADLDAKNCAVIVFGGSYGGMLSAYMRIKYPNIVDGALASSAPVVSTANLGDSRQFFHDVTKDFERNSPDCVLTIRKGFQELEALAQQQAWSKITSQLSLCKAVKSKKEVDHLYAWARNAFTYLAMFNYPYKTEVGLHFPANPVDVACRYILTKADHIEGLLDILGLFYNSTGNKKCFDIYTEYIRCSDPTGCGLGSASQAWDFQACTEINLLFGSNNETDMFPAIPFTEAMRRNYCHSKWGVYPNSEWLKIQYWGDDYKAASNIIFSNGDLDPWANGGILKTMNPSVISLVIEGAAHHLDLRATNAADPPSVTVIRKMELSIIRDWVKNHQLRFV